MQALSDRKCLHVNYDITVYTSVTDIGHFCSMDIPYT